MCIDLPNDVWVNHNSEYGPSESVTKFDSSVERCVVSFAFLEHPMSIVKRIRGFGKE